MPNVVVIGASADRSKFGNKSVRAHAKQGYNVYPVHPSEKEIEGFKTYKSISEVPEKTIDRVSMYVPPQIGLKLIDEIAKKSPAELWLNPGADSPELVDKAEKLGLNVISACSIVDIGESPSNY